LQLHFHEQSEISMCICLITRARTRVCETYEILYLFAVNFVFI